MSKPATTARSASARALPSFALRGAAGRASLWAATLLASVMLSACGGGDGSDTAPAGASANNLLVTVPEQAPPDDAQGLVDTGQPLDLALTGAGHFVTLAADDGSLRLTRYGHFGFDAQSHLVDVDGNRLAALAQTQVPAQAPAQVEAQVQVQALPPVARRMAPQATTRSALEINLDARREVLPDGLAFAAGDPSTFSNATSQTVYDSQGQAHVLVLYFRHLGPDAWGMHLLLDEREVAGGPVTLQFLPNGAGLVDARTLRRDLSRDVSGQATGLGVVAFDLTWLTQFGAAFGADNISQNGYPSGTLQTLTVDAHGNVTLAYSNGVAQPLGTLAVAMFSRSDRVLRSGTRAWRCGSLCSGLVIGEAGTQLLPQVQQRALNAGY